MRKRLLQRCLILAWVMVMVLIPGPPPALAQTGTADSPAKTRSLEQPLDIAILDLDTLSPDDRKDNLGYMVSEMLRTEAAGGKAFVLIERKQLEAVLSELELGQSGIIQEAEAQKIGRIAGADAVLIGSVMRLGSSLRIDARLVDVETGRAIASNRQFAEPEIQSLSRAASELIRELAVAVYGPESFDQAALPVRPQPPPAVIPPAPVEGINRVEVERFVDKFLGAMNGGYLPDILDCYAERVDYFAKTRASRDFIRKDKERYYARWPQVHNTLDGSIIIRDTNDPLTKIVRFPIYFDVRNPGRGRGVSGRAENTLKVRKYGGTLKIVEEKQKVLSRKKY